MPVIQAPGIGSGLDVNSLVSQLVAAERAPGDSRLKKQTTAVGTEISALGTLKGALAALNSTLGPLKTIEAFSARTATSGDDAFFTSTATSAAIPGSYSINVGALATAQQLRSDAFGSSSAVVGSGTLTISLGTASFNLVIDPDKTKLSDIRDAINAAPSNVGVRAAIVNAVDGAHLVLNSTKTGLANTIKIAATSDDGLQNLSYDVAGNTSHYDQVVAANDSSITIAGLTHTSASNTVTDAIDGVSIVLKKVSPVTDPVTTVNLEIAANTSAAKTRVSNFVSQYNAAVKQLNDLGKYDAATGNAGPLIGDGLLRAISAEVRHGATDVVSSLTGAYKSLAEIGITTAKDGTLSLDDSKLSTALSTNSGFDAVGALFGSSSGIATRLSTLIDTRLAAKADIATRNASLDKKSKDIGKDKIVLDQRMARVEANYRRQFTVLDQAMGKMQSTSSYLSQQLANLPKIS